MPAYDSSSSNISNNYNDNTFNVKKDRGSITYHTMEQPRLWSGPPPLMPQPHPGVLQSPPRLPPSPAVPPTPKLVPYSIPTVSQPSRPPVLSWGRQSSSRPQSPYASPPPPFAFRSQQSSNSQSQTTVQGSKINQLPMTPLSQQPTGNFAYTPSSHPPHSVSILPPSLAVAHSSPSTPSAFGNVGNDYFSAGIPGLPPLANELRTRFEQQGLDLEKSRSNPSEESNSQPLVRPQSVNQPDTPISQQVLKYPEPPQSVQQPPQQHHHHQNGQVASDLFAQEADERWPIDRVVQWLAQNGFSILWQEAFRKLHIEGLGFIELAGGVNGRLNYSKMHERVYPQLKSLAIEHGDEFNAQHEREEGRRMRKLIRHMVDSGTLDDSPSLGSSGQNKQLVISIPSASTDGGIENSPGAQGNSFNESPLLAESNPPTYELPSFDQAEGDVWSINASVPSGGRSATGLHRNVFGTPDDRRHSRTPSYDSGIATSSYRSASDGTYQAGSSPASKVAYSDLAEPPVDSRTTFSHNRQNSWETVPSQTATTHQLQHQYRSLAGSRPVPEMQRVSPLDAQKHSGERDHGKGFLGMFSRKKKSDLQSYHEDDSPTSPHPYGMRYASGQPVFPRSGHVNDPLYGERPLSVISDYDRHYAQTKRTSPPPRKYILVTQDGWNYRLVDVTDFESPESLRAALCQAIGITNPATASIFLTEPGQSAHVNPLNDVHLDMHRRRPGTINLFIHHHSSTNKYATPVVPSAVPLPEKRPGSAVSLGEESMKAASHGGVSESAPAPNQSQPSSESDLMAAHEQYKQEVERKQKAYLQHRHENNSRAAKATSLGIKRDGVIDFDAPRASPYEDEKRAEKTAAAEANNSTLVPRRKPPSAPSASHTLTKVNSLRKSSRPELIKRKPVDSVPDSPVAPAPATSVVTSNNRVLSYSAAQKYTPASPRLSVLGRPQSRQVSLPVTVDRSRMRIHERDYNYTHLSQQTATLNPSDEQHQYKPRQYQAQVPQQTPAPILKSPPRMERLALAHPSVEPASDDEGLFAIPLNDRASEQEVTKKVEIDDPDQDLFAVKPRKSQKEGEEDDPDEGLFAKPLTKDTVGNDKDDRASQHPDSALFAVPISSKGGQQKHASANAGEDSDDGLFAVPITSRDDEKKNDNSGDGDEDGDLFAVPLSNRPTQMASAATSSPNASKSESAPKNRKKTASVSFVEPEPREKPERTPDLRRMSAMRDDVWASRPPVEGMIERLDDFFPNVDLDEPFLESNPTPPALSPVDNHSRDDIPQTISESPVQCNHMSTTSTESFPPYVLEPTDTPGSTYVSVRHPDNNITIQRRPPRANGGLGRMRSIRQVARGTHELHRQQSIRAAAVSANTRPDGPLLRRKSTKMFGAKIMEIKPRNGRRLSQLDPIPQDVPAPDRVPQRQPTFRIVRGQLIGKGTYGKVFIAFNADTGDILAVKQVDINHNLARDNKEKVGEMMAALDQEIDTMQHLEHPNIVQYLGCERGEMSISIFLEYIPGGSVGSCLRKHGKFEESLVKSLARQTLDGLAYLHDQGILHRDLKADNILLDLDGTCKISDFGISKKTDDIYGKDSTNSMQGSVFWMAPEVIRGQGYSAKVDIWSLGCVVLEMFAGRRPWEKEEMIGAIFKLGSLKEAPPIPDDVAMSISPAGLGLMYDCFTVDPSDRPTASTLLNHAFCEPDPHFRFINTQLYAKIRHVLNQ
ncbi:hypothetical protein KEM54_004240 [Ascosphaera aggregata]|nr:hypothetical protein KEM54_004240 [Ascosphaera aggregata]